MASIAHLGTAATLHDAWVEASGNRHPLRLRVADTFFSRFRGLMLRGPLGAGQVTEGLLLARCTAIHTAFMGYAIDAVYLDHNGRATRCAPGIRPWRASRGPRSTAHTLELPAGSIDRLGLAAGDRLFHPFFAAR